MKTLLKILVAGALLSGAGQATAWGHGHIGHVGGHFSHGWGGHSHWSGHGWCGHGWGGHGWCDRGWGWGLGIGFPAYYGCYAPYYGYSGYYSSYPYYGGGYYGGGYYGGGYGGNCYNGNCYRGGGHSVSANVQAALSSRGYDTGGVDGVIGPQSRAAIRRYQADHGLAITGGIDGALLHSLRLG